MSLYLYRNPDCGPSRGLDRYDHRDHGNDHGRNYNLDHHDNLNHCERIIK